MASSSNGLPGAAVENANIARVSAAIERLEELRAAAAEAVRVSADHLMNEGLRNVGAAERGRDSQSALVPDILPAWFSGGQRFSRPEINPTM